MDKISTDLIKGAFGTHPHDFYITYDELTDELIVRMIDPSRLAYIKELENNDEFALLVELDSEEIIGFQLFNFERKHLKESSWSNLQPKWDKVKDFYRHTGFVKYRYDPGTNENTKRDFPVTSLEFYKQSARVLQKELSKSPA